MLLRELFKVACSVTALCFVTSGFAKTTGDDSRLKPAEQPAHISIDKQNFDFGFYFGNMNVIQGSTSSSTSGIRVSYQINDLFFLEADVAKISVSKRSTSVVNEKESETLSLKYDYSIGANLFPGEIYLRKNWVTPIYFYAILGAGSISIDDQETSTLGFGGGVKWLPFNNFSVRFDYRLRNYTDVTQEDNPQKITPSEASLGFSYFF